MRIAEHPKSEFCNTLVHLFGWFSDGGVSVELLQDCFAVIAECGVFILL